MVGFDFARVLAELKAGEEAERGMAAGGSERSVEEEVDWEEVMGVGGVVEDEESEEEVEEVEEVEAGGEGEGGEAAGEGEVEDDGVPPLIDLTSDGPDALPPPAPAVRVLLGAEEEQEEEEEELGSDAEADFAIVPPPAPAQGEQEQAQLQTLQGSSSVQTLFGLLKTLNAPLLELA
jgi:hypothetical protein